MEREDRKDSFQDFPFVNREKSENRVGQVKHIFEEIGGHTYTVAAEHAALFELARGVGHDISDQGYCLDIGTWYGMSGLVMAMGVRESRVVKKPVFTIDAYHPYRVALESRNLCNYLRSPTDLSFDHYLNKEYGQGPLIARGVAYKLGLENYLCQIIHDSILWLGMSSGPLRLVFIDGSHDFCTVTNELDIVFNNLLVPGGWVVFHDYVDKGFSDVIPAVNNFIDNHKDISIFKFKRLVLIRKDGE